MSGSRVRGRVVFIGAVHEAVDALEVLLRSPLAETVAVVTPTEDALARLSGGVDLSPRATAAGVEVIRTEDVNGHATLAALRERDPDLVVAVGWTRLLGDELLALPRHGCVGFHASLLPRHRGRAPVNWAIMRGETTTGNTMMMLAPGADTGDIVDQRVVRIDPDDTCGTVYRRVAAAGADMLREHLPALLDGTVPRRPQDPAAGDVLPKRTPGMGAIDWATSPRAVHDWVRALTTPYPGAFTTIEGTRVMVWRTRVPGPVEPSGAPGRILAVEEGGVRVGTGGGSVVVTRLSDPGGAPDTRAVDWCARRGVGVGDTFEPIDPATARWCRGEGPRPEAAVA
jgi:methionyl-tRNA formyltransferase